MNPSDKQADDGFDETRTEVRYGGVFGAVTPCNLYNMGRVSYTWNRW